MCKIKRLMGILMMVACVFMGAGQQVYAADEEWLEEQFRMAAQEGNIYTVAQDGSGDYRTIQEGVDAVCSGDTLLIYPGRYIEAVEIKDKTVNLIGVDRDSCMIQYDASVYCKVPLTLAAGRISNLTICGLDKTESVPFQEMVSEEDTYLSQYSGYAVHIDQEYQYGRELSFDHCRIESYNSYCVGIGSWGDSRITFEKCELLAAGEGGCIYLHDSIIPGKGGISGLTVKDTIMQSSKSPYIMTVHAMFPTNDMFLTFQNVRVYGVAYDEDGCYCMNNMNIDNQMDSSLLHVLSLGESRAYLKRDMLKQPILEEGVTYIRKSDSMADKPKTRQVINVYNADGTVGDGWCGLNNTWLTSDSYGNTLAEMNSVVPVLFD